MAANIDCRTTSDLDDLTKHGESSRPVNRFSKMTATKLFPEYGGSRADSDCSEADIDIDEYTGSLSVTFYSSGTTKEGASSNHGQRPEETVEDLLQGYTGSLPAMFYSSGTSPASVLPKNGESLTNTMQEMFGEYTGSLSVTFYSSRTTKESASSNQGQRPEETVEDLLQGYTGSLPAMFYSLGTSPASVLPKNRESLTITM